VKVGIGYDVHAFAADRPLVLGGVTIPAESGLAGHSDADVVCHAIADALLGAVGLGDIGDHFPGTEEWAGVSGTRLLGEVVSKLREAGWAPHNVDASIVAEKPRLGPHRQDMRRKVASELGLDESAVSIKATTSDGLGSIGRGEGIACLAVASVEPLG
jgi:2-C-methyl-D-erythritol 2,4-cyclodiphosphate synthase